MKSLLYQMVEFPASDVEMTLRKETEVSFIALQSWCSGAPLGSRSKCSGDGRVSAG